MGQHGAGLWRAGDGDLRYAGDLRRNHVHHDARRVDGAAAGHVQPDPPDRPPGLRDRAAGDDLGDPVGRPLLGVHDRGRARSRRRAQPVRRGRSRPARRPARPRVPAVMADRRRRTDGWPPGPRPRHARGRRRRSAATMSVESAGDVRRRRAEARRDRDEGRCEIDASEAGKHPPSLWRYPTMRRLPSTQLRPRPARSDRVARIVNVLAYGSATLAAMSDRLPLFALGNRVVPGSRAAAARLRGALPGARARSWR